MRVPRIVGVWVVCILVVLAAQITVVASLQEPFYPTDWPEEFLSFWLKEFRPLRVASIILIVFAIAYIVGLRSALKFTSWMIVLPIIITAFCVIVMLMLYFSEIIHYSPMFKHGVAYVDPYKVALLSIIYSSPIWVILLFFVFFSGRNSRSNFTKKRT